MNSNDWNLAITVVSPMSPSKPDLRPPGGMVLVLSILTMIAAWLTPGALSCDEHFQVFEYARFLMGQVRGADLAWEFSERIRPLLQPLSISWILEAAHFAGLSSPFDQALFLRMVNGLLSASTVGWLAWVVTTDVATKRRRWAWLASQALFFIPILNVHPMSEVWGGVCLAVAIVVSLGWGGVKKETRDLGACEAILVGALSALSFVFRYQMAFALIGLFLWLAMVSRRRVISLLVALVTFAVVLGGATLADGILYQQTTFAPWRYFNVNILQGRAADFGVEPFYQYGVWLFTKFPLPFGPLIGGSTIWFIVNRPKHVLTWVFVPFVTLHCLMSHKEVRFLYPMAPVVAAMFAVSLARFVEWPLLVASRSRRWTAGILFFLVNAGAAAESVSMLRPRIMHLADAFKRYPGGYRLYWSGDDPTILCSRRMWGYLPPATEVAPIAEFSRPSVVFLEYDRGTARPGESKLTNCSRMPVGLIEIMQDQGLGGRVRREVLDCAVGMVEKESVAP